MSVVPLTVIVGLCLVLSFVVFFLREHARGRISSSERDSLLPLAEEIPRIAVRRRAHDRDDTHDACGCSDGLSPPCVGCVKRREHN